MITSTKHATCWSVALAAAIFAWCINPTQGSAFGTVHLFGQDAEHEKITRLAFELELIGTETLEEIAGPGGLVGAVGQPDMDSFAVSAAHCDDSDARPDRANYPKPPTNAHDGLRACRQTIVDHLKAALDAAGSLVDDKINISYAAAYIPEEHCNMLLPQTAKCRVIMNFGRALHTAQDFCSHSNWSDWPDSGTTGDLDRPPGLGHVDPAPYMQPAPYDPNKPDTEPAFPQEMLLTGCFPNALCSGRTTHEDLNKDEGTLIVSTHEIGPAKTERGKHHTDGPTVDNFTRAVRVAVVDTQMKWAWLHDAILTKYGLERGNAILCVLRSDNPQACEPRLIAGPI